NLKGMANTELMRIAHKAFIDVMLPESKKSGISLNKLMNSCVYLISYIKRYIPKLFSSWKYPEVECFIHFGPCVNENEALFLKFLSRLPVDVLVLVPDLKGKCLLSDKSLYEENHGGSLSLSKFPRRTDGASIGTSAYYAERELDTLMYQDSGMYRNQQYGKADTISLKTMYEEIPILWKEEVKYRPGFATSGDTVKIPVIFAKVSGVKDGNLSAYWNGIRELLKEEAFLITEAPHIDGLSPNPIKAAAPSFLKRGKLFRDAIKNHRDYKYGFLRDEVQEHILDKLQLLLNQRLIKGTYENGTEYTIIATVLNMGKEIMRMLQKFDFTKKNPKLIYIVAGEKVLSLEDSIMAAFLNLTGFDIVFFVPTGYESIEKHFNSIVFDEHEAGEYMYDLKIPQLKAGTAGGGNWFENLFKGKLI
ncbi:MAG: YceG family protein, partial [Lachnospiraceae bacterium]|nr:YceG family protein [Lachnospiraceae bacterium]